MTSVVGRRINVKGNTVSIRSRLDDAFLLYQQGRRDGALLSVLVGVAATSRRRYPRPQHKDSKAFAQFVADETPVITGGGVKNFAVRVPGGETAEFPDGSMPLGVCFYRFVRCNLAHEATLPSNVEFVATGSTAIRLEITDDRIRLSDSFMDGLSKAVIYAPENADLFPDAAEMPPEVVAWNLFGPRREHHADYMTRRAEFIQRLGATNVAPPKAPKPSR